eukprot:211487-Amphidinium_carterae.1
MMKLSLNIACKCLASKSIATAPACRCRQAALEMSSSLAHDLCTASASAPSPSEDCLVCGGHLALATFDRGRAWASTKSVVEVPQLAQFAVLLLRPVVAMPLASRVGKPRRLGVCEPRLWLVRVGARCFAEGGHSMSVV